MDVASTDVEDNRRALELRFHFQAYEFSFVWSCLQEVGWTYRNTTLSRTGYQYQAPGASGPSFDSWEMVVEYLDQFALPNSHGTLELILANEDFQTIEEIRAGIVLRQQALRAILQRPKPQSESRIDHQSDSMREHYNEHNLNDSQDNFDSVDKKATVNHLIASKDGSTSQTDDGAELYMHAKRPIGTSRITATGHQDARLELPSVAAVAKHLKSDESPTVKAEVIRRDSTYKQEYSYWRFLLSTNHSLCLFGAGSKYNLLSDFCDQELSKEGYVIQIDDFEKDVTVGKILDLLVQQFLGGVEPEPRGRVERHDGTHNVLGENIPWRASADLVERAILVSRSYAYTASETLLPIFLVLSNLDGELFRNKRALSALAALVVNSTVENGVRAVRLVAGAEHVATSELMGAPELSANLSWIHLPVHTHRPYIKELALIPENNKRAPKNSAEHTQAAKIRRVEDVLELLAPRHTEVMQVLARLQLELQPDDIGVKMPAFRKQCKESHIIAKDSGLDNFLNELMDHGLVEIDRRNRREDIIRAPFSRPKLQEILKYRPGHGGPGNAD